MNTCKKCGNILIKTPIPCPDGRSGCLVAHSKLVCEYCESQKMKPRYYIKTLTDDGRLIGTGYSVINDRLHIFDKSFDTFDDAVAFLDRHDIHGAVIITVIEMVG